MDIRPKHAIIIVPEGSLIYLSLTIKAPQTLSLSLLGPRTLQPINPNLVDPRSPMYHKTPEALRP